jgi:hypothetical protein
MNQTRQATLAIKQSIFLDFYEFLGYDRMFGGDLWSKHSTETLD